jgi:hypothetical protein
MTQYRNWKIERVEGTQVGHTTNAGTLARAGIGTKRKVNGFLIHYPDGGTKWFDTLKEAKAYIDKYEGL